jgi:ABC-type Na+ transport system ATPase subunit NatA
VRHLCHAGRSTPSARSGTPPDRRDIVHEGRTVDRVSTASVISIEGLRKVYRRVRGPATVAVDGLDLSVPAAGVFGFLGPNGAGKTTTIRTLLGLARPSAGHCRVFGFDTQREFHRVQRRVGTMIETQALFPGFSARRNLSLLADTARIPESAVDQALERVALVDRADDRLATYSLGMRQRLGLAAALLKDPELLVLDEPANGLDPAGIRDVRRLLRRLGTVIGLALRVSAVAAGAALLGYAAGHIGRSTAGALALGLGYVIAVENVVGSSFKPLRPWMMFWDSTVFVKGHFEAGGDVPGRSTLEAGLVLLAYAIGVTLIAVWLFRTRDAA